MRKLFWGRFKDFWRDQAGVSIVVVALALPALMASAGIAVDLAQAYNIKTRLGNALDKAALAAGTTTGTNAEVEARITKFIEANYPEGSLGTTFDVSSDVGEKTITVKASAKVPTAFMGIFGINEITVNEESQVIRELSGVEVALVLDVTGSMAGNNITALRTASLNFLDIMFTRIADPDYIKVGIVPFSESVNVGAAGLNDGFVSRPASDPYVSPASSINYSASTTTTVTTAWKGCVLERASPKDTTDDRNPNWVMFRYPGKCTKTKNGVCTTYTGDPNKYCTNSRVVPLTNDRTLLENTIKSLAPEGGTYGNVGMVWGWRLISPDPPFTQGVAYDDPDWSKIVIMMTDGDNSPDTTYSAYGTNSSSVTASDLNKKYATVCTNMKAVGITVYTITFQSAITNATRQIFRDCASDPSMYFNAPSNDDLILAFQKIANQLSQLHLSK